MKSEHRLERPGAIALGLCCLAVCLTGGGCEPDSAEGKTTGKRPARVETVVLAPEVWSETISSHGIIEAAEEVTISIDFSAKVDKVLFEEGQKVEEKATLIELDTGKRELRLTQADTAVKESKARLDEARSTLQRRRELVQEGTISRESLDAYEVALRRAVAQYDSAVAAHQLALREVHEGSVCSPVSGLVKSRDVEPGENVMPGRVLGSIQAVDRVRVVTFVSEKDINHLRVGAEARVMTPAVPATTYTARIESIGVEADPRTGNFEVKLILHNESGLLRPGMSARATLPGRRLTDALLLPDTALVDRHRRRVVYVVVEGQTQEVSPVLELTSGNEYLVRAGLEVGDEVIVTGAHQVGDGMAVEVVNEPAPGQTTE